MRTAYSNGSKPASVDSMMTPMIDVVILLLVFFLATSSFQRLEKTLPSATAATPEAQQQGNAPEQNPPNELTDVSDVVVKIQSAKTANGEKRIDYSINGEKMDSLNSLSNRLLTILRVRADVPIVIDPQDDVPAGEAIQVYDIARNFGSVAVFLVAR